MKKLLFVFTAIAFLFCNQSTFAQTTIVNYDFNSGSSYGALSPTLATNITSTASGTETFTTYGGTASGSSAFVANSTAGNALAMSNSSGTNTRYWTFQLGGSALNTYQSYKLYLQAQRSTTGAQTITIAYSTNGSTFTNFSTTLSPPDGSFGEQVFDLSSVSALNFQSAVYFRIMASGASGTGTLRIDNFEILASVPAPTNWSLTGNLLGTNNYFIGSTDAKDFITKTNNIERMRITSDGKIGIGTTTATPTQKLEVAGTIYSNTGGFKFPDGTVQTSAVTGGGTGSQWTTSGSNISFNTGNVGIGTGTTTPTQKLQVAGTIYSTSGGIKFPDGSTQTTAISSHPTFDTIHVVSRIKIGSSMLLDGYPTGNQNGIYTDATGDPTLYIQSQPSPADYNTFINNSNNGMVAIGQFIEGAFPDAKLHVSQSDKYNTAFRVHKIVCSKPDMISDPSHCMKKIMVIDKETAGTFPPINETIMVITDTGNVGIGTLDPTAELEVAGGVRVSFPGTPTNHIDIGPDATNNIIECAGTGSLLINPQSGKFVGIGCANAPQYMLDVNGTIRGKEMRIELAGCDFVFDKNYNLLSLNKRREKVLSEKHLPNIAPAFDMQKGQDLGAFTQGLLQNLEEHEHYLYQQNDRMDNLEKENVQLKIELENLKKEIEGLKKK